MTTLPCTIISPIFPDGRKVCRSSLLIAISLIGIIAISIPGKDRPTQVPCPRLVKSQVSLTTSVPSMEAMGRLSVAPYGVWITASSGSTSCIASISAPETGAPAIRTFFNVFSLLSRSSQEEATTFHSAGEPKE